MKYIKTYELTTADGWIVGNTTANQNRKIKKYIIIENHPEFRHKDITNILFKVSDKIIPDMLDGQVIDRIKIKQLKCYINGELYKTPKAYNTYNYILDYIYQYIIYQSNNLEEAEDMLDILENAKKYNL